MPDSPQLPPPRRGRLDVEPAAMIGGADPRRRRLVPLPIIRPTAFALAMALLLGGAPAISGCDDAQGRVEETDGQRKVRLELWTWALRPWFDDYMTELVADFEAQHPEVDVLWVDIPDDAMRRKMFAVGAAGQLPDVINFSDRDFGLFASLGALQPLGPIAPSDPHKRYIEGALEAGTLDGQILGVPWYLSTPIRVMNTSLLAEGDLTPETLGDTWEVLLEQARAFYEKTGKYLFSLPLGPESDLPSMLMMEGIEILKFSARPEGGYESNLTDPRAVEYVRRWVDLYRSGALPREAATEAWSQMVRNYTEGRVAMINGDATRNVKQQAPAIYAVTEVAHGVTGSTGEHDIAVTFVSVSKQSRHPEWAAKLAWHVTSPKWQERLAKRASRVPGTQESLTRVESFLPEPAEGESEDALMRRGTLLSAEQMTNARSFQPQVGPWPDMARVFNEEIQRALLGGEDVAKVLTDIEAEWNRILGADAAGLPYK